MKVFCHRHSGFYEDADGCLYCRPVIPAVAQATRPIRVAWSICDVFPIDHDYHCSGISWGELEEIYKDTVVKASVTVFSNAPMGAVDLTCILGYDVAARLMKNPPRTGWMVPNYAAAEFLGIWKPAPYFKEVYLYSDLRAQKQFIPSDCVLMTSFLVDSVYLQHPNFNYIKLFDPLEITVTARGY